MVQINGFIPEASAQCISAELNIAEYLWRLSTFKSSILSFRRMFARLILPSTGGILPVSANGISLISRRWFLRKMPKQGKPPNLPPSKRVLYRIVDAYKMRPDIVRELLWRRHVYNNAVESMREVFRRDSQGKADVNREYEEVKRMEEEEFEADLKENEERNKRMAEMRSQRLESDREEVVTKARARIEELIQRQAADCEERAEEVESWTASSSEFITPENLEAKIEEALENPVVYEYALDLEGKQIPSPTSTKYQEGVPTKQTGRIYDQTVFKQLTRTGRMITVRSRQARSGA